MFNFNDPVGVTIITLYVFLLISILYHWYKVEPSDFDDDVVENNIRRLNTNQHLNISIGDVNRAIRLVNEVSELRELLEDPDLNHYMLRQQIHEKLKECVQIYRKAGVPDNRIICTV